MPDLEVQETAAPEEADPPDDLLDEVLPSDDEDGEATATPAIVSRVNAVSKPVPIECARREPVPDLRQFKVCPHACIALSLSLIHI